MPIFSYDNTAFIQAATGEVEARIQSEKFTEPLVFVGKLEKMAKEHAASVDVSDLHRLAKFTSARNKGRAQWVLSHIPLHPPKKWATWAAISTAVVGSLALVLLIQYLVVVQTAAGVTEAVVDEIQQKQ